MIILGIDPGDEQSGFVVWNGLRILEHGIAANVELLEAIRSHRFPTAELLAVEMIAGYGMAVGMPVFRTCVWIGRFVQAWAPAPHELVFRKDIKTHLCGTTTAGNPHVRQALIDRVGPQGTKRAPGPTHGVSSHAWSALAVAVFAHDKHREGEGKEA